MKQFIEWFIVLSENEDTQIDTRKAYKTMSTNKIDLTTLKGMRNTEWKVLGITYELWKRMTVICRRFKKEFGNTLVC